jgi:hypothetical protein
VVGGKKKEKKDSPSFLAVARCSAKGHSASPVLAPLNVYRAGRLNSPKTNAGVKRNLLKRNAMLVVGVLPALGIFIAKLPVSQPFNRRTTCDADTRKINVSNTRGGRRATHSADLEIHA